MWTGVLVGGLKKSSLIGSCMLQVDTSSPRRRTAVSSVMDKLNGNINLFELLIK